VAFQLIDRYLLGEPVSKAALVERLLAERSPLPAAAPFYRALEAVGVRAADTAFIALRVVLGGGEVTDDRVRRLQRLSNDARAARNGPAAPATDASALADAEAAYRAEVAALAG